METEGDKNRNDKSNVLSDGPKKPKRQMKTPFQLGILEKTYALEMDPSKATRSQLSKSLGLTDRQLQMWFCHRRLKDNKKGTVTVKKSLGDQPESPELVMTDRGGVGGSNQGSRSRSRSGSESGSSWFNEPVVRSRVYELSQQKMMLRRIVDCVEVQLGESLREDGPALGVEFDELPPGAFGTPIGTC